MLIQADLSLACGRDEWLHANDSQSCVGNRNGGPRGAAALPIRLASDGDFGAEEAVDHSIIEGPGGRFLALARRIHQTR